MTPANAHLAVYDIAKHCCPAGAAATVTAPVADGYTCPVHGFKQTVSVGLEEPPAARMRDRTQPASDLAAIRARADHATEGPWAIWRDLDHQGFITVGDATGVIGDGETWTDGPSNTVAHVYIEEDAEFIAHARADVVWLLDLVDQLQTRLAQTSPEPGRTTR